MAKPKVLMIGGTGTISTDCTLHGLEQGDCEIHLLNRGQTPSFLHDDGMQLCTVTHTTDFEAGIADSIKFYHDNPRFQVVDQSWAGLFDKMAEI